MALDVKVKIELVKPIGSLDWGYPLIVSQGEKAIAYTECAGLAEVEAAGFANTTATYKAAEIIFKQNHAPAKIAVCALTTVDSENLATLTGADWRQLVGVGEIPAATLKTYIDTTAKMYFAACKTAEEATALAGSDRVVAVVHGTEAELAAAAVAGEVAGNEVGSITYKNLIITGVTAENIDETAIKAIHDAYAITILAKAGDIVTSEGYVTSGEYADIIDCQDYVVQQLTYKTQKLLNKMGKVPYDNTGIAMLENVAIGVFKAAYLKGMIAVDDEGTPLYSVNYALRSQVDEGDIEKRLYKGGQFAFTISGAIHNVDVTGEISVA